MQFHVPTITYVSAAITATIAMATLFYSLARKENRTFIWVAVAVGGFALALYLSGYRGRISDFASIIIANELGTFTLVAFFEGYRRLLRVRPRERFVGPLVLLVQFGFFIWFTYYNPCFHCRMIVINFSVVIMSACFLKLLWSTRSRERWLFHFFAALPFVIGVLLTSVRLSRLLFGQEFPADSLNSPYYAMTMMRFGIMATWMSLSIFFIVVDRMQTQLRETALTDPLTGTLNRRALRDVVEREIARSRRSGSPLTLIISDLDHFKKINDEYGHQVGDAVLAHTAKVYKKILREEDVLARYGGEEFVAILPGMDISEALSVAERLRHACRDNGLKFGNHLISVTCSFGVSAHENDSTGYEALLKRADEALYLAKESGRDRIVALRPGGLGESST